MCGLTGFTWQPDEKIDPNVGETVTRMADTLAHRGPDDSGTWMDEAAGVALGHRRLAIIDLSQHGHQPMHSAGGRFVIAFNGEIYNFRSLRQDLAAAGARFRGDSDTEVLLAAFEHWGIDATIVRLVGMFAIALWDRRDRHLTLIRDRLGIKPLYYGWVNGKFVFASELKAFRAFPEFDAQVDRDSVATFLRRGFIPGPQSIYQGVYKLPPGHLLTVDATQCSSANPMPYWTVARAYERGLSSQFSAGEAAAVSALEDLIRLAVGDRMVADVPLGAFLSGGIDSSTVVAIMQSISDRPIRTFSIGSIDEKYDESKHAEAVARHLGTEHTELVVTESDALATIPLLPSLYDEPFADASQLPTYLVSKLTREHVTVSLSGDGGDELFSGYNRHLYAKRLARFSRFLPRQIRPAIAGVISGIPTGTWNRLLGESAWWIPAAKRTRLAGEKMHKVAESLRADASGDLYSSITSLWNEPNALVIGGAERDTVVPGAYGFDESVDVIERFVFRDQTEYLPDDILTKVDRASMGVGLEARVPLLDHRLVEFSWTIPQSMKLRGDEGKWLLRQVLYKYVPPKLVNRPKAGFAVPIDSWLRGELRDWGENLLDRKRLIQDGLLEADRIRKRWDQHLSGERDWQNSLWSVLMLQAWLAEQ